MHNPLGLLVVLALIGFALYLFNLLVPMEGRVRNAFYVIAGFCVFLYVMSWFGFLPALR